MINLVSGVTVTVPSSFVSCTRYEKTVPGTSGKN